MWTKGGMVMLVLALGLHPAWLLASDKGGSGYEPISTIGVLAFEPKPRTLERWAPLVAYLNGQISDTRFVLKAYTNEELDVAARAGELEFIFAQPSHYVRLTYEHALSSPLATLHNLSEGMALDRFGGVIFTRADRSDLQRLTDLKGQRIATPSIRGLGGYQMQAYELLQAGVRLSDHATIIQTGQPQGRVIEAVLSGEADAGFVRTGLIESWVANGRLDADALRIVAPRTHPRFPFASSTRLYPEWPFAALEHTDRDRARQVAAALLALPHGGEIARSMGISGFSIPGDYRVIDEMLRSLRLPPFDTAPEITLQEVWQRWAGVWIGLLVLGVGVASFLLLALFGRNSTLSSTRDTLLQERARLSSLLEALPDPIWLKDSQGVILECNRAFGALFDRPKAELIGQSDSDLFEAAMVQRLHQYDRECLQKDTQVTHEEWTTHPSGQNRLYEIIKTPMRGADGALLGVLGIGRDTTLRHEHEQMLESFNQTLNDRIQEALAQKEERQHALIAQSRVAAMGEMVSAMAHHWRQPLTAIGLLAYELKESYLFGDLTEELMVNSADRIGGIVQELSTTINDLRAFNDACEQSETYPAKEIKEVVHLLAPQLAMADITLIDNATQSSSPTVKITTTALRQALFNLIINARDAILANNPAKRWIRIDLEASDQMVRIGVADSGGGIDPMIIDRIYEPFFTTKERGRGSGVVSGAGLGLYVSKQIIEEQIAGRIEALNGPDGAIFTIHLPAGDNLLPDKTKDTQ